MEGSRKTQHINSLRSYIISERCDNWSVQGFKQGIEYRYPLLDIRIIEYILQIPSKVLVKYPVTRILIRNILKGVFPEKARTENSKLDYVLNESFLKILKESSNVFIDEIGDWENNSDLSFINFSALKKDALKLNSEKDERKKYNLMQSIYFFKMLHEFTKTYRSLPPESE